MKLELKENMYYRTYSGFINKIISIKKFNEREYLLNGFYINKDTIKKASHNIIDLIEVGDYVNGIKVVEKWEEPFGEFAGQIFIKLEGENAVPTIRKIESVLTKEEMERMAYKVGE